MYKTSPKTGWKTGLAGFFAIGMVLLLLFSGIGSVIQSEHQEIPETTTTNYIPNPVLNTNITWSTYNSSWGELEYSNGSALLNLSAEPNPSIPNPITIKPQDMIMNGTLQNDKIGSQIWNKMESAPANYENNYQLSDGSILVGGNFSFHKVTEPYLVINSSENGTSEDYMSEGGTITISQLPSDNLAYDYFTIGMYMTGANITGAYAQLRILNGTTTFIIANTTITPGQSLYTSLSLAQIQKEEGGKGFNATGSNAATEYNIQPWIVVPKAPGTDKFNLTLFALSMTEYPIILGQNSTGAQITQAVNEANLTSFKPTTQTTIENNGYTVAVSQSLQNPTETQNPIASGEYTESQTLQGNLVLPPAPDLTYSNSNISMNMTIPGNQYQVLDLNGISYLSQIQNKSNGTFSFGW